MADKIMTLLLSLVTASTKQTTVLEDAFLVVGAMATSESLRTNVNNIINHLPFRPGSELRSLCFRLPALPLSCP